MSRTPAFASIVLAGLLPAWAAALGLGEIESKSFLNQPLSAEIPVVSDDPAELSSLDISLASPETFAQYGLQRSTELGDLQFAVTPGPRGGTIRITSAQAISEPFLTMLLEVSWAQGRLLREYTVLLDPPTFASGAARQAVQAPSAPVAPETPITREPGPAAQPESTAPRPAPAGETGERTHAVAPNETLWGIADRYRPDRSTDINRAMMSIYRANPEAFGGNINRLRAGAVLRIPGAADMQRVGGTEAQAEVQRQNQEWKGRRPPAAEPPARLELVPPPEAPAPAPGVAAAAPAPAGKTALQAQIDAARRQLAIKDAELSALRDQVAALEEQAGQLATEPAPADAPPSTAEPAAEKAPVETAKPVKKQPAPKPEQPAAAPSEGAGVVGVIVGVLTSIWFWLAAAAVVAGAALLARRRSADETPSWQPAPVASAARAAAPAPAVRSEPDMIVVEEPKHVAPAPPAVAEPEAEEESPLERTISTEGSVNLDQDDPLAEAEFHMAYGLYDQAADLLTAALGRAPARRDLLLKLLDVYFVWENREGFLKQARALREKLSGEDDADWKRVAIMGRQLCGNDPLFAGAAGQASVDMDFGVAGGAAGTLDFDIGRGESRLDLDVSRGLDVEADNAASTRITLPSWATAQTQELPTIEAPEVDRGARAGTLTALRPELAATQEALTVKNPDLGVTQETPTIEAQFGERTLETPTLETVMPGIGGATAKMRLPGGIEDGTEQTAEIDLDELGLDLEGLEEAARDMQTGLQEALPEEASLLDFDLTAADAVEESDESTAEMKRGPGLEHITNAMGKRDTGIRPALVPVEDTAEQPALDSSMIVRGLSDASREIEAISEELGEELGADMGIASEPSQPTLTETVRRQPAKGGPGDQTMTEVGTKLDLARAYLDMGDPDGARSILNEVLEEGDQPQRQEARQLLDSMNQ